MIDYKCPACKKTIHGTTQTDDQIILDTCPECGSPISLNDFIEACTDIFRTYTDIFQTCVEQTNDLVNQFLELKKDFRLLITEEAISFTVSVTEEAISFTEETVPLLNKKRKKRGWKTGISTYNGKNYMKRIENNI